MNEVYRGNDPHFATKKVRKIKETLRKKQGVLDPQLDFDLAVLEVLVLSLELDRERTRRSRNPFSVLFKRR